MRIIIGNVQCQAVIGGADNLLPYKLSDELRDYMKVHPPGYNYAPAYRRRRSDGTRQWDGYKYFINTSGFFATGFLPMIFKFLEHRGIEAVVEDRRTSLPVFYEDFNPYIGKILSEETGVGEDWYVREYQQDLLLKLDHSITYYGKSYYFPRGIIDAATNAGKNSIMAGIVRNVNQPKALMLIHSREIFKQAYKFFSQIFHTGVINDQEYTIGMFTIAMSKSLLVRASKNNSVKADLNKFNILFCDEAHNAGGDDYSRVLEQINAGMRVFVSGSALDGGLINNMTIVGLSGPTLGRITNKELFDLGVSIPPKVHIMLNKPRVNYANYDGEAFYNICRSKERVECIIEFLKTRRDKITLVAFDIQEHGKFMYEALRAAPELQGLVIDWAHGKHKDRSDKIARFKRGEINILIGSTIMQEGLNLPKMNVLVYAIGGKAKIPVKQFVGRVVRQDGVSEYVEVLDFYDVGDWIEDHSKKRIRTYKQEGFDITYHYPHTPRGTALIDDRA